MGAEFTIEPKTIRPGGVRFILKAHWLDDARATIMAELPLRFLPPPRSRWPSPSALAARRRSRRRSPACSRRARKRWRTKVPLKPSAPRTRRGRLTKEKGVTLIGFRCHRREKHEVDLALA